MYKVLDLTPVLDTAIYAADDVLFVPTVVPLSYGCKLESVHILDEDDQGIAIDLLFFNATASIGALNAAFALADAEARKILARVQIATGDYLDIGNSRIAFKQGLDWILRPGSTGLWVAGVTRGGTPTYSAAGLKFKFGVSED
jgi:hypothetical protein